MGFDYLMSKVINDRLVRVVVIDDDCGIDFLYHMKAKKYRALRYVVGWSGSDAPNHIVDIIVNMEEEVGDSHDSVIYWGNPLKDFFSGVGYASLPSELASDASFWKALEHVQNDFGAASQFYVDMPDSIRSECQKITSTMRSIKKESNYNAEAPFDLDAHGRLIDTLRARVPDRFDLNADFRLIDTLVPDRDFHSSHKLVPFSLSSELSFDELLEEFELVPKKSEAVPGQIASDSEENRVLAPRNKQIGHKHDYKRPPAKTIAQTSNIKNVRVAAIRHTKAFTHIK